MTTPAELPRRFVVANHYGLMWSPLSGIPSGEVSLFLGSSLRPRLRARGKPWRAALGYELTASLGGADFWLAYLSWSGDFGILYHRHHIVALGYGGPSDRLYYQIGGGVLLWRTSPIALEVEGRLGFVLGVRRGTKVKGVIGGTLREVVILNGRALPTFGIFAGLFMF